MRPGDSYTARQVRLIRDAVSYFYSNLDDANEALGTNYKEREIDALRLPAERESAASNYKTREA